MWETNSGTCFAAGFSLRKIWGGYAVTNLGHAAMTALTAGICTALLFAILLGSLENFNYAVTERSVAAGALTAVVVFVIALMRSTAKRKFRY
jgi:ABC-type enterobactin transport system permease subunit